MTDVTIPSPGGVLLCGQALCGERLCGEGLAGDTWVLRPLVLRSEQTEVIFPIKDTTVEALDGILVLRGQVVGFPATVVVEAAGVLNLVGETTTVNTGVTVTVSDGLILLRGWAITLFLDNILRLGQLPLQLLGAKLIVNPVLRPSICIDLDLAAVACANLDLVAAGAEEITLDPLVCLEA